MKRTTRPMAALLGLLALAMGHAPAQAFCIWGFGSSCEPANPLVGEYSLDRNPATTLTIAPAKITSRTGPVSFSAGYAVKSVDGNNVTIEVAEPKETVLVQVEKDVIKIRNTHLFAGDWRKKAAGR